MIEDLRWILCWCAAIGTYLVVVVVAALVVGAACGWLVWWLVPVVEVSWTTSKSLVNRLLRPEAKPAEKTVSTAPAAQAMKDHLTR